MEGMLNPSTFAMYTLGKCGSGELLMESFEEELVIIASEDSGDQSEEGRVKTILNQWTW